MNITTCEYPKCGKPARRADIEMRTWAIESGDHARMARGIACDEHSDDIDGVLWEMRHGKFQPPAIVEPDPFCLDYDLGTGGEKHPENLCFHCDGVGECVRRLIKHALCAPAVCRFCKGNGIQPRSTWNERVFDKIWARPWRGLTP